MDAEEKYQRLKDKVRNWVDGLSSDEEAQPEQWGTRLTEYLNDLEGRKSKQTIETYAYWLQPWVAHLKKHNLVPSSLNIRTYLNNRYDNHRSYKRVGAQIVLFHNTFVNKKVRLIAPVGKVVKDNRVQMPAESMDQLGRFLEELALRADALPDHHYKNLGKCLFFVSESPGSGADAELKLFQKGSGTILASRGQ